MQLSAIQIMDTEPCVYRLKFTTLSLKNRNRNLGFFPKILPKPTANKNFETETTLFESKTNNLHLVCKLYPLHGASLPFHGNQIILLDDKGTCVNNLTKVVTWKWNDQESNPWSLGHESNVLIISQTFDIVLIIVPVSIDCCANVC